MLDDLGDQLAVRVDFGGQGRVDRVDAGLVRHVVVGEASALGEDFSAGVSAGARAGRTDLQLARVGLRPLNQLFDGVERRLGRNDDDVRRVREGVERPVTVGDVGVAVDVVGDVGLQAGAEHGVAVGRAVLHGEGAHGAGSAGGVDDGDVGAQRLAELVGGGADGQVGDSARIPRHGHGDVAIGPFLAAEQAERGSGAGQSHDENEGDHKRYQAFHRENLL